MSEMEGYEAEAPQGVTLEKLTSICKQLVDIREAKRRLESELKKYEEQSKSIEAQVLEYLEQYRMPSFRFEGGQVSVTNRKSVRQPETLEAQ